MIVTTSRSASLSGCAEDTESWTMTGDCPMLRQVVAQMAAAARCGLIARAKEHIPGARSAPTGLESSFFSPPFRHVY